LRRRKRMANDLFTSYLKNMLGADTFAFVDFEDDVIKGLFVDHTDITPLVDTHDAMDDITAAGRVPAEASAVTLGARTTTGTSKAVIDAADMVFTALTGDQVESFLLYKDTGTESTSPLCCFWDTATGLPLTPNGGDVTVVFAVVSGDTGGIIVLG
jgi:hypothetical protein